LMHKYLGKGVRKQENITDMAIAANTANTDQKRENLLNLSLSVSEEERIHHLRSIRSFLFIHYFFPSIK
jgi:predicted DNA binding CopG/RHH family protein